MRLGRMQLDTGAAFAATGILIATNGPSIWLTNRRTHVGYDIEAWPYLYPFALLAVVAIVGLARHRFERDRPQLWAVAAMAIYVAWMLLSATWSVAPNITTIRALVAAGVAAFGVWFGVGLSRVQQLRAVSTAMGIAVVASALLVRFRPLEGGGYWDGERHIFFRGIFANANSLGPVCVVGAVSFVSCALLARRWSQRCIWYILMLVSLWLLWRSGSDTARAALLIVVIGCFAGMAIWLAYRGGVPKSILVIGSSVLATTGIVLVIANFWQMSDLVAGDSTFGGRRQIWDVVLDAIPHRLWQGHGYWAYINGPGPIDPVLLTSGSAHNAALEVLLDLGIVGLVPFVATVGLAVYQIVRGALRKLDVLSLWPVAMLAVVLLENVTESFVLFYSYIWVLLIAASFAPSDAVVDDQTPAAEVAISSSS